MPYIRIGVRLSIDLARPGPKRLLQRPILCPRRPGDDSHVDLGDVAGATPYNRPRRPCAYGIAEDVITALSRFNWFFVIARNSSFTYKGGAVDVKRVSEELGVRYVLEGSGGNTPKA